MISLVMADLCCHYDTPKTLAPTGDLTVSLWPYPKCIEISARVRKHTPVYTFQICCKNIRGIRLGVFSRGDFWGFKWANFLTAEVSKNLEHHRPQLCSHQYQEACPEHLPLIIFPKNYSKNQFSKTQKSHNDQSTYLFANVSPNQPLHPRNFALLCLSNLCFEGGVHWGPVEVESMLTDVSTYRRYSNHTHPLNTKQ